MNNGDMKRARREDAIKRAEDDKRPIADRYLDAYVEKVKKHAFTRAILTDSLESEMREIFPRVHDEYEFVLSEEHVAEIPTKEFVALYEAGPGKKIRKNQARLNYSPYKWAGPGQAGWPTGWWFRLGQEKWEKSTWRLLPALPASMLAAMGYPLVTSCRYMGDLSDEQKADLLVLLYEHELKGWSTPADVVRTKDLLSLTSYGMELPILDVDTVKRPKDTPSDQIQAVNEKIGRAASDLAIKVSAVWKEILGIGVRWTVTNDRGGLHGRSLPLPADLRHPDLLMMLMEELIDQCRKHKIPFKLVGGKGEWKETDLATIDLSTFQKSGGGRGGQWRTPGSKKDAHMGSGSLAQTPVAELVGKMPWLASVTPEALGSDWTRIADESKSKILALCTNWRDRKDDKEIKSGHAVRGEDGKVRKVRTAPIDVDEALGKTEFGEVARTILELMPKGETEGMKRHDVRLAVAGWLYKKKLSEEAAAATLAACGMNYEDSIKVVRTTYARARAGEGVAGHRKLVEIFGKKAGDELISAFDIDVKSRIDPEGELPEDHGHEEEEDHGDEDGPEGPAGRTVSIKLPSMRPVEVSARTAETPVAATPTAVGQPSDSPASTQAEPVPQQIAELAAENDPVLKARKTVFPSSLSQFYYKDAKGRGGFGFNGPHDNCVLENTREALTSVKNHLNHANRFWFATKVVAEALVYAGVGLDLVTRTSYRGNEKFGSLRECFVDAEKTLKKWEHGEEFPKLAALSSIKTMVGFKNWLGLTDAIQKDLHKFGAPFDVVHRATIDQCWSSGERELMNWFLDTVTDGDRSKRDKGRYAFVHDAMRCGYLFNKRTCPVHGQVSAIPVVCEKEVSCKYCRAHLYAWISEWITHKWTHDRYVTFEVFATTDPVVKEIREKLEVDASGKFVDKKAGKSHAEDEASKYILLPRTGPDEKRFTIKPNASVPEKWTLKIKMRRRSRHKVIDRKVVDDLLDRIKIGFTKSADFKEFKATLGKSLGVRAWPTRDGIRVVMPASFFEVDGNAPELAEERSTLERLKLMNVWQTRSPKEVSKEEVISLILEARCRIGEEFDRLIYDLGNARIEEGQPVNEEAQAKADAAEHALANYAFLRNGAMRPVKNKRAEVDLPWFTKGQMREFMKQLAAEKRGKEFEVDPRECPMPVPDEENGGEKPCKRVLHCGLHECRTDRVVDQNSLGKYYPKKEAFELAAQFGVSYTTQHAILGNVAQNC